MDKVYTSTTAPAVISLLKITFISGLFMAVISLPQTVTAQTWPREEEPGCCNNPSPSVSPSIAPSPIPSPTPASSPNPSSSPTPDDGKSGKRSSLSNDNLVCSSSTFDVVMDLRWDGNPTKDHRVVFTFNGERKEASTNENGRARTSFDRRNGTVTAEAQDYSTQSMSITAPECENVSADPDRGGKILGVSTLAGTGKSFEYWLGGLLTLGLVAMSLSLYAYSHSQED